MTDKKFESHVRVPPQSRVVSSIVKGVTSSVNDATGARSGWQGKVSPTD
jgi:hypothetical protein